jgi:hypothetical protein
MEWRQHYESGKIATSQTSDISYLFISVKYIKLFLSHREKNVSGFCFNLQTTESMSYYTVKKW